MAARARSKHQREKDLEVIADMILQGFRYRDIAEHLNALRPYRLSEPTICRDAKTVHARWREHSVQALDQAKAKELERLALLERRAWAEYESSCKPARKVVQNTSEKSSSESVTIEEKCGDPRYLTIVQNCMERRAKLLGLDAPSKIAPTTPDGESPWDGFDLEALDDIAKRLAGSPD